MGVRGVKMQLNEYFAIILGIFIGCILFDLINSFFNKPFYRFGYWLGENVRKRTNRMLKFLKKDKFYKIGDSFIKLSKIFQMSKLNIHSGNYNNEYMQGFINWKEYKIPIYINHYKPEYRQQAIEEEPFYQEYTKIYKDFLEYNNIKDN